MTSCYYALKWKEAVAVVKVPQLLAKVTALICLVTHILNILQFQLLTFDVGFPK